MWTPRRIVLLMLGFLSFFGIYLGYGTSYIGRIDGLPPLPPAHHPRDGIDVAVPQPARHHSRLEEKLTQAFGPNCPELTRPIRVELHARNMVLTAAEYDITKEGQVTFNMISVIMFGKDRGDGRPLEMNTIRGDFAVLTFERPVSNLSEVGSNKVVEARLERRIEVVSNRRRPQRDQDLRVEISKGPLFYSEPRHLIWTQDWVRLVDNKPKPHPHRVRGLGMEMELLAESRQPRPGAPPRKGRGDSITGIKRIALHSAVEMELYVDGKSGFLGGQQGANRPAPGAPVPAGDAPPPAGPSTPPSHVHITTPGRFTYDIFQDHDLARFELPEAPPDPRVPMDVTVVRHHPAPVGPDQLICQYLELRILRRAALTGGQQQPVRPAGKEAPPGESGLDIETAHALRRGRKEVVLTSDSEKLVARGHDFFYDARKALTVLKGEPTMEANKDGSVIIAREMRIQDIKSPLEAGPGVSARVDPARPAPRTHQEVTAQGPGEIHLLDKATDRRTVHAYWQDKLVSGKDGPYDLLVLTGDARFVDEKDDQNLKADTIKVWLEPAEKPKGATPANSSPQQSHRPQHLEATGRVIARSRELNINDSNRLVIWFKNVPVEAIPGSDRPATPARGGASGGTGGAASPGGSPSVPAAPGGTVVAARPLAPVASGSQGVAREASPSPSTPPAPYQPGMPLPPISSSAARPEVVGPRGGVTLPAGPVQPLPASPQPKQNTDKTGPVLETPGGTERPKGENPRPIDLQARSVEVWVLRSPVKNQLDKVWCEGEVHVRQDASRPEDKDTTVDGQTLQLTWTPQGNLLTVTGDLAQLRMDKIYIIGPEVNIDQATNKAWVHGVGAMQMESKTNFQGEELQKSVPLTVHWNKNMFFDGASAEFHGGIQAEQEKARLACQHLEVFFDKTISLKENKGGQDAKVRRLVCDQEVRIEDSSYQGEQLVKYQRIEGRMVEVNAIQADTVPARGAKANNNGNQMVVSGPGTVRILQAGGIDPLAPPEKGPAAGSPPVAAARPGDKPDEMKMTYVSFQRRMNGDSLRKTAKFWGGVRVLNLPCKNPNMPIDLDTFLAINPMPEGALYLRCERLEVFDEVVNGKSNQQMEAHDQVYVQAREFYARADSVFYNQAKDQVIFDGTKSGRTTLWKIVGSGTRPQEITGKKIIYSRKTGKTDVVDAEGLSGESVPGGK
jgi:lipopolysaccharide export system protein LptA